jgi:hypothetical protein
LDTPARATAWVNGKPVTFSATEKDKVGPRSARLDLGEGSGSLLIRVPLGGHSGAPATLVTTIVADRPVGFSAK